MNLDFDPKKNYYDILWVDEDADTTEIQKAYRKLAMKYHPDRNKWNEESTEKFKEINEAKEILTDEQKKQQYDAFRKGWFGAWGFWGFQWWWGAGGFSGWVDLWDLLGWFFWWGAGGWFGGWWWQRGPQQWDDLMLQMVISFEDSFHGVKKKVTYKRKVQVSWAEEKKCETCGWRWVVNQQAQTPFWVMQTQRPCSTCGWQWVEYYKDGEKLSGGGLETQSEELTIKIPAGIKSWNKIKYAKKWNAWPLGWPTGDLYVKVIVKQSDKWERAWDDIVVEKEISLFDAVLWWETTIEHPDGTVQAKIPKGLQVWEQIRVNGKWFGDKWLLKSKWDLIIKPQITIPQRLKKNEEKLWKELAGRG